jgi:hypothetical protein
VNRNYVSSRQPKKKQREGDSPSERLPGSYKSKKSEGKIAFFHFLSLILHSILHAILRSIEVLHHSLSNRSEDSDDFSFRGSTAFVVILGSLMHPRKNNRLLSTKP